MPAIKQQTTTSSTPSYHVTDAYGTAVRLVMLGSNVRVTIGGTSFQLTQQNAADLVVPLSIFASTGHLS